MPQIDIVIVFATWFLLVGIRRIVSKKNDVHLFLFLVVLILFVINDTLELNVLEQSVMIGIIYGGFAVSLLFFNPTKLTGKDQDFNKLTELKKEHEQVVNSYESLRKRFIATIELMPDGLSFRSDDGSIFATAPFVEMIGFNEHEFRQDTFEKCIHPDDYESYRNTLRKLSKKAPNYDMRYRFKKGAKYIWIKEKGSIIFYEKRMMIIALIKTIDAKQYPTTEVEVLNKLRIDREFYEHLQAVNRNQQPYWLIITELSNIPAINTRFGRDVGDLMMGEFINKIRYNFMKDTDSIYRLSGIRFAIVIKDPRKYEILERALAHGGDLLNFEMTFGGIKQNVYPNFGIQRITFFEEPIDEIVARTVKALDIALDDKTQENYFIIGK